MGQVVRVLIRGQARSWRRNDLIVVGITATLDGAKLLRHGFLVDLMRGETLPGDAFRVVEHGHSVGLTHEPGLRIDLVVVRTRRERRFVDGTFLIGPPVSHRFPRGRCECSLCSIRIRVTVRGMSGLQSTTTPVHSGADPCCPS